MLTNSSFGSSARLPHAFMLQVFILRVLSGTTLSKCI
jgi:hypothetical protein